MLTRSQKIKAILVAREKEKRLCQNSYFEFFKRAWKILEPQTPLKLNWHIKYLCDVAEAEVRRIGQRLPKTKDIIVNISPRSGKSQIFSVMLCPWAWINYPWIKFLNSSHSSDLSIMHSVQSRDVIRSEWYQRNWHDRFKMSISQDAKSYYENDKKGHRMSVSVGSGAIGKGGDIIIADDILSFEGSLSEVKRKSSNDHYSMGLHTRINDQKIGVRIIVMQRLHEDDVTGDQLKDSKNDYLHINVPAKIVPESAGTQYAVNPQELKQYYKNDLFFAERFSESMLEEAKKKMRSQFPGQFLQMVVDAGGGIWKRKWFKFYRVRPKRFEREIIVCDMNFEKGDDNSFVVIQHWGRLDGKNYLLSQWREQEEFLVSRKAFARMCQQNPNAHKKIVEKKANGPALESSLKRSIPGIVLYDPGSASKETRWMSVADYIEDGKVLLPHPDEPGCEWVVDYLNECDKIPNATNDDQADATFMALNEFEGSSIDKLKKFLEF